MAFPTPQQIEEMFLLRQTNPEAYLEKYVDDNIALTITGQPHAFSGEIKGKDELKAKHVTPILGMLDLEKSPPQGEVVRVLGGGDSAWAAVEMKTTSQSKAGSPWVHENAYFIHFNNEGKIDIMRGYYDSAHLNKHNAEHKK